MQKIVQWLWRRVRRSRSIVLRAAAGVGAAGIFYSELESEFKRSRYASQEPESERPRLYSPDCNLILISSEGSAGAGRFFPESEPELEPLGYFTRNYSRGGRWSLTMTFSWICDACFVLCYDICLTDVMIVKCCDTKSKQQRNMKTTDAKHRPQLGGPQLPTRQTRQVS